MRNLAIIPARAGSKRIPGKNKRFFLGKPLIQWTMDAALAVPNISLVVVTTDDTDILNMASSYPDILFIKREDYLATDAATSVDVMLDVMSKVNEQFDNVILLQPTSPLRGSKSIVDALNFYCDGGFKQIVSVRPCFENVLHLAVESEGVLSRLINFIPGAEYKLVTLNGAIYISDFSYLKEKKSLFTESTGAFLMENDLSIDIDSEEDWMKAEKVGVSILKDERL